LNLMGSFKVKLVVWFALLALLPLAVAFYGYDTLAVRSETRRADASLQAGLRAAAAGYAARLDHATTRARRLAAKPLVQEALRTHDRAELEKLLPARPAGPAGVQTVSVVADGRVLGRVSVYVPLTSTVLASLDSGLPPGDRLLAVRYGRVVVGPGAGTLLDLVPGTAARVRFAGRSYRGLLTTGLSDPPGLELAALTPQSEIDAGAHAAEKRIAAALIASLVLFALVTYLLGRSIVRTLRRLSEAADAIASGSLSERVDVRGNDEFAHLAHAFNGMAAQLEQRLGELELERVRVQEAVSRFGEALAATHDVGQLVRVVVESAVETTGAVGGIVLGRDGELARAGDPDAGAERIALPLRVGNSDFGLLVLTGDGFDAGQVEAATSLAAQVVVALENARLHRIVERQALVDSLTGLANRRSLEETLRSEIARSSRFGGSMCLVLADLDDFKRVNDRWGHAAGDEVLVAFAATLRETVRESDTAGRWGGEEFALILTGTDADGGARLAERARVALEARSVRLPDGSEVTVTASFGVACCPDWSEAGELLAAADSALYEAKRSGKNRVARAAESASEKMV
jgi:diguanylate cyclase (GGDEF)-like protein